MSIDAIIDTLELSVQHNGEQPLTNKWLLSILKLAKRIEEEDDYFDYMRGGID